MGHFPHLFCYFTIYVHFFSICSSSPHLNPFQLTFFQYGSAIVAPRVLPFAIRDDNTLGGLSAYLGHFIKESVHNLLKMLRTVIYPQLVHLLEHQKRQWMDHRWQNVGYLDHQKQLCRIRSLVPCLAELCASPNQYFVLQSVEEVKIISDLF